MALFRLFDFVGQTLLTIAVSLLLLGIACASLYVVLLWAEQQFGRNLLRWRLRSPRWPIAAFVSLLLLAGISVGLLATANGLARRHVRNFVIDHRSSIVVSGSPVKDADELLDALASIRVGIAHHSSPGDWRFFRLQAPSETIDLRICQDSKRPDEYWVYWPINERLARKDEIGTIHLQFNAMNP